MNELARDQNGREIISASEGLEGYELIFDHEKESFVLWRGLNKITLTEDEMIEIHLALSEFYKVEITVKG